jgi:parallel beta-helix repeat protein
MPDPITWYALPKKVDDPTTIEEMVDAKILEHNLDPSAHSQSDEALYFHRISQVLDHVNYSIYNIKLHPETRPIKAFVDAGGAAEFSDLQSAIDYVHALGGGKIFVKEGVYYPKNDIILYSNLDIEGEDNDTVIIDFENSNYQMKAIGTSIRYLRNIHLKNIQIRRCNKANEGAVKFKYCDDISIENCKFYRQGYGTSDSVYDIFVDNCTQVNINSNYSNQSRVFCYLSNSIKVSVTNNFVTGNPNEGITGFNVQDLLIQGNFFQNVGASAITIDGSHYARITDNQIEDSETIGIAVGDSTNTYGAILSDNIIKPAGGSDYGILISVNSKDCIINSNYIEGDVGYAIGLGDADRCIISNNRITGADTGIYISSQADRTICLGNNLYDCTVKITNNGTNTELGHNITS